MKSNNSFPPPINIPEVPVMPSLMDVVYKVAPKVILCVATKAIAKRLKKVLRAAPEAAFEFNLCELSGLYSEFDDYVRGSVAEGATREAENLTAENLLEFHVFEPSDDEDGRKETVALDFFNIAIGGLLTGAELFEFLNGNISDEANKKIKDFFTDKDITTYEEFIRNPNLFSDLGTAFGNIINVNDLRERIASFDGLPARPYSENLCADSEIEDNILENQFIELFPTIENELREIINNNENLLLEDADDINNIIADPDSFLRELREEIPNLIHPSISIPPIVLAGEAGMPEIKNSPVFITNRDDYGLGRINIDFIKTTIMGASQNTKQIIRNYNNSYDSYQENSEDPEDSTAPEDSINYLDISKQIYLPEEELVNNNLKEKIYDKLFSYEKAKLVSSESSPSLEEIVDSLDSEITSEGPTEVPLDLSRASLFVNKRIDTHLNEEFDIPKNTFDHLMRFVLGRIKPVNPTYNIDFYKDVLDNLQNSNNENLYNLFGQRRMNQVEREYETGMFKPENTFRRFIPYERAFSEMLLHLTDAELLTTQEVFISLLQAVLIKDLGALLALAQSGIDKGKIKSELSYSPYTNNDMLFRYYSKNLSSLFLEQLNIPAAEASLNVALPEGGTTSNIIIGTTNELSKLLYMFYQIDKINLDDFESVNKREKLATDVFIDFQAKALIDLSQTLGLQDKSNLSQVINDIIIPFEAPFVLDGLVKEETFSRLEASTGDHIDESKPFLASTVLYNVSVKADSPISDLTESLLSNLDTTDFVIRDKIQRFLNKEDSLLMNPYDLFGLPIYRSSHGFVGKMMDILRELEVQTIEISSLENFINNNFDIKLDYRIYSGNVLDDYSFAAFQSAREMRSKHSFLASNASIESKRNSISIVELVSYQSRTIDFLEIKELGLDAVSGDEPGLQEEFIDIFMTRESKNSFIKDDLYRNPDIVLFFSLCFPFSDIISRATIYFSTLLRGNPTYEPLTQNVPRKDETQKNIFSLITGIINKNDNR